METQGHRISKNTTDDQIEKKTTYALGLSCPCGDPFFGLLPGLVEGEEAGLASSFDKLVWLCDEFGVEDPAWELGVGGDGVGDGIP